MKRDHSLIHSHSRILKISQQQCCVNGGGVGGRIWSEDGIKIEINWHGERREGKLSTNLNFSSGPSRNSFRCFHLFVFIRLASGMMNLGMNVKARWRNKSSKLLRISCFIKSRNVQTKISSSNNQFLLLVDSHYYHESPFCPIFPNNLF